MFPVKRFDIFSPDGGTDLNASIYIYAFFFKVRNKYYGTVPTKKWGVQKVG